MLEDLEIFCAIAKYQGFSKAAKVLQLSASVVTRSLVRLEKNLNIRLMNRTTRLVVLTEAGQRYYHEIQPILDALNASNKSITQLKKNVSGTLKVGLPVSITHLYVTDHLHTFFKKFPNIKVHIVNGNHLLNLLEEGFDIVMHCGELPNSRFHYVKLGMWNKIISASPSYLKNYGAPLIPSDLSKHNCLDHSDNFHFNWKFQEKGKETLIPVSGNTCINSSIDLCKLATHGLGVTYLPSFSVDKQIKSGELVSLLEDYRPAPLPMYLVYPSNQYLNEKTRVFIEFMKKIIPL